ncbi:threonine synthase [Blattabacterium cuenoti]|uniref:threonine synthase n=1 Tax=Blattabacterium cuenoti TaxID=1653831 RepID=UPI00163CDE88|nr:threonine synthase [Blattabacterium cuenoti]
MLYHSLKNHNNLVSFEDALLNGLSPDGSLYVPQFIPLLDSHFIQNISDDDINHISFSVIKPYIQKSIPTKFIYDIIHNTLNYPFPLKKIHDNIYVLELFHGPTLAFKDVGSQFMSECLSFFHKKIGKMITILVATSGDTGGAVARGFYKKAGIEVIILYPYNGISSLQKKQISSLGENIYSVEVNGSFDDCQKMVKQSFLDKEIQKKYTLTSANSINIARLLPQMFYYFISYKKILYEKNYKKLIFSVPSGNFGNVCAGIIAKKMGLPINTFIASTNINNTIPIFMQSGKYNPTSVKKTISNAMDISDPSNFPRIWNFLYQKNMMKLKSNFYSYQFTDKETLDIIESIWNKYQYMLDPHGAIGYLGIQKHMKKEKKIDYTYVFLETAHPIKFYHCMPSSLKNSIVISKKLKKFTLKNRKPKNIFSISNTFNSLKYWLLNR